MPSGRGKLSAEERVVGVYPPRPHDGWHQPGEFTALVSLYDLDAEPSAEDSVILQSLKGGSPS